MVRRNSVVYGQCQNALCRRGRHLFPFACRNGRIERYCEVFYHPEWDRYDVFYLCDPCYQYLRREARRRGWRLRSQWVRPGQSAPEGMGGLP